MAKFLAADAKDLKILELSRTELVCLTERDFYAVELNYIENQLKIEVLDFICLTLKFVIYFLSRVFTADYLRKKDPSKKVPKCRLVALIDVTVVKDTPGKIVFLAVLGVIKQKMTLLKVIFVRGWLGLGAKDV